MNRLNLTILIFFFGLAACGDSPSKGSKMIDINSNNANNQSTNNTNNTNNATNNANNTEEPPPGCGDGVVVAGEVCDGNCPTSCDDGNACTVDGSSGSANLCNLVCVNDPITACTNDDGCCAPGCTSENDNDCACEPTTCAAEGATCGSISNGCGSTLDCGGCGSDEACENNTCVMKSVGETGDTCSTNAECSDICANAVDFRDGFCTSNCNDDFDCNSGTHCVGLIGYRDQICMPNCQADNDCRSDGYGCWDADGDGTKECAPQPQGTSPIGGPCAGIAECNTEANLCITNEGFPNGYCSRECFFNGMCPFGSICLTNNEGGFCAIECELDSECRQSDGYACVDVSNDTTGEDTGMCLMPQ